MTFKAKIMDDAQMRRAIIRMSNGVIEAGRSAENVILMGVQARGMALAKEIAKIIEAVEDKKVPVVFLDIKSSTPLNPGLTVNLKDSHIILVDDVLHLGRACRVALDILTKAGEPKTIQLAVLIDRGIRSVPLEPSYVGKTLPPEKDELVSVSVMEVDGRNGVETYSLND
jgi:pyrimidine operon attenuation protein/uracil phosphoribosyltransferase